MNKRQQLLLCLHDATLEWYSTLRVLNMCTCEARYWMGDRDSMDMCWRTEFMVSAVDLL